MFAGSYFRSMTLRHVHGRAYNADDFVARSDERLNRCLIHSATKFGAILLPSTLKRTAVSG